MHWKRTEARPKTLLESIDALIEEYHLLKHPLYQEWIEGRLDRETLQLYAEQYYQHVRAFPDNLKQLAGRSQSPLAEVVEENLADEENPHAPRPVLWRQFAESVGVSQEVLETARPLPGIAALLDTFDEVSLHGSLVEAVAAFYAYEAQVPEISRRKISSLRRFYNVTDPQALAYFEVHEEADVRHRAAWRSWLASQATSDNLGVLLSAERSLKALWGALDAVYSKASSAAN